eukprot:6196817-Pleurochrysis_carterae.AAC.3
MRNRRIAALALARTRAAESSICAAMRVSVGVVRAAATALARSLSPSVQALDVSLAACAIIAKTGCGRFRLCKLQHQVALERQRARDRICHQRLRCSHRCRTLHERLARLGERSHQQRAVKPLAYSARESAQQRDSAERAVASVADT